MSHTNVLKNIYPIIQIIWGVSLFAYGGGIVRTLLNPADIRPPVDFYVEKAGEVKGEPNYTFEIPWAHGHVKYPDGFTPSTVSMIVLNGADILEILLKLFVLFQIKLMVKRTIDGTSAFNWKNTRRLRWIAFSILAIWILSSVETIYAKYYFEGDILLPPVLGGYSDAGAAGYKTGRALRRFISSGHLLTGLSALLLSYVFQEGATLKEETELTI